MWSVEHGSFAVETPDTDLDEMLKVHEAIMASFEHLLEEVREAPPTAYAAPDDRSRLVCV